MLARIVKMARLPPLFQRSAVAVLAACCAFDRRCSAIETVKVEPGGRPVGMSLDLNSEGEVMRGVRQNALYNTNRQPYGNNPYGANSNYGNYNPYGSQTQGRPPPTSSYYDTVRADFTQLCAAMANQQCGRAYATQCFCGGNVCCDPFNACCENMCFYMKYGGRLDYQCGPGPQGTVDLERTWCRCGAASLRVVTYTIVIALLFTVFSAAMPL